MADSAERIAEIKRKTEEKRKKLVSLALTRPRTICGLCARRRGERRATSDPSRGVALAGGPQGQEQEAGGGQEADAGGGCEGQGSGEGEGGSSESCGGQSQRRGEGNRGQGDRGCRRGPRPRPRCRRCPRPQAVQLRRCDGAA